jgi:hypothetical protein
MLERISIPRASSRDLTPGTLPLRMMGDFGQLVFDESETWRSNPPSRKTGGAEN